MAAVAPIPNRVTLAQQNVATIVHSSDGVLLRAEPAYDAEVLTTIAEGTTVELQTHQTDTVYDPDGLTQWWPIRVGETNGWVAGFFLELNQDVAPAEYSGSEEPISANMSLGSEGSGVKPGPELATWDLSNAAAIVAEPEGVNLREDPAAASPKLRGLPYETVVRLRVDELDTVYADGTRWWPVEVDGLLGWVAGSYLAPLESAAPPAAEEIAQTAEIPSKASTMLQPGTYAIARTDDGSGLNIRADGAHDAERIGSVPENDIVQVMDGPFEDPLGNPWYLITDGGVTGFVSGWYLEHADQPGAPASAIDVPSKVAVPGVATGRLTYPLASYTFTQAFGCSPFWFEPWNSAIGCNFHNGIDLAANLGTPLYAADGGIVEYAGWCDCGLGYYVKIDHGNGIKTLYGHMSELWVSAGEAVSQNDPIGAVGSTGISTGPHVHFIVELNGVDQDPLAFLS